MNFALYMWEGGKRSVLDPLSEQSLELDVCRKAWKLLRWTLKTNLILYSSLCILRCHQTLETAAPHNQSPDFEACKNYQGIWGVLPGAHEVFMSVPCAFHWCHFTRRINSTSCNHTLAIQLRQRAIWMLAIGCPPRTSGNLQWKIQPLGLSFAET